MSGGPARTTNRAGIFTHLVKNWRRPDQITRYDGLNAIYAICGAAKSAWDGAYEAKGLDPLFMHLCRNVSTWPEVMWKGLTDFDVTRLCEHANAWFINQETKTFLQFSNAGLPEHTAYADAYPFFEAINNLIVPTKSNVILRCQTAFDHWVPVKYIDAKHLRVPMAQLICSDPYRVMGRRRLTDYTIHPMDVDYESERRGGVYENKILLIPEATIIVRRIVR